MIRFAVSRPQQRLQSINEGLKLLDYENDVYLKNYGLKISPTMLKTQARLLAPPAVEYGKGVKVEPGYSGRWRMDGKPFWKVPKFHLQSWGVCILNNQLVSSSKSVEYMLIHLQSYENRCGYRAELPASIHDHLSRSRWCYCQQDTANHYWASGHCRSC